MKNTTKVALSATLFSSLVTITGCQSAPAPSQVAAEEWKARHAERRAAEAQEQAAKVAACEARFSGLARYPYSTDIETSYARSLEDRFPGGCLASEVGEVNGVSYSINMLSGAARFDSDDGTYIVFCEVDAMTDRTTCRVSYQPGNEVTADFRVWYSSGQYQVTVGRSGERYPHTPVSLRVDGNPPVSGREDQGIQGADARRLLAQMRSGHTVLTRHTNWPYRHHVNTEARLRGFSEAIDYVTWLYENGVPDHLGNR